MFNLVAIRVPDPVAFYPLNSKYTTREIKNRQPQATPVGVSVAAGPDGKAGSSYQFTGLKNSYIEFLNNGGLDVQHSITLLCWLYPENTDGPIFNYKTTGHPWAVHLWIHTGQLYGVISQRNYVMIPGLSSFQVLAINQWHYVGFTYNHVTGMANLWLDNQRVVQRNIGTGFSLSTQDDVRMGALENDGRYFKGRITAMQIYDVALNEEQINAVENAGQGNIIILLWHVGRWLCLVEAKMNIIQRSLQIISGRNVEQEYLRTSAVGCLMIITWSTLLTFTCNRHFIIKKTENMYRVINLPAFYHECHSLIGYTAHYLFCDR